jgi:hypothetical protein
VVVFDQGVLTYYDFIIVGVMGVVYTFLIVMICLEKTSPIPLLTEQKLKENERDYN